ncbi:MAG: tetratricopeptide repeat protein [Planctomycetota bacterium]
MTSHGDETQPQPRRTQPDAGARLHDLFTQAFELSSGERTPFLDQACGSDASLRAQVEALLQAHSSADEFLAEPGANGDQAPGERIDRYKLLQKIGEGGFGVVWMAEQTEPVRRKVALKVIKLGMDTRQVVARFEAERQALAMMDHPHIAKVFDGGVTAAGRPYFVMELVRGVPITQFCDEQSVAPDDRLRLLQSVCRAVQHAHHKGIIHRDLKPSNVLVSLGESGPVPKVIDFGIAKATSQELTDKTLFTEMRQLIGTPDYMAPEQAELSGLDVDTRADVYSLGVLLYELLTGTRPFDTTTLRAKGYAEMLRHIKEIQPQKPSTRISTLGEALSRVARERRTDPARLGRLVRGDLDWIVMKALEKDRRRRYSSANALADDLERYINLEPVAAGPPSATYRLTRFAQRNRALVVGAATVLLALVAGIIATGVMLQRALRAEQSARLEADRASTILTFTDEMLAGANPYGTHSDYTLRQLLDDYHAGLGERLRDHPEAESAIRLTMGKAYRNLAVFDKAEEHLRRALEIEATRAGTPRHRSALYEWGVLLLERGDYDEAEKVADAALRLHTGNQADALPSIALCNLLSLRSHVLRQRGELEESERLAREAVGIAERLDNELQPEADAHEALGKILRMRSRYDEAEAAFRRVVATKRRQYGREHPFTVLTTVDLATTIGNAGRHREAEELLRETIAVLRKIHPDGHPFLGTALHNLATQLRHLRRGDEAETLHREALAMTRAFLGDDNPDVAKLQSQLGVTLSNMGRLDEAETLLREALPILRAALGDDHTHIATSLNNLAVVVLRRGDAAKRAGREDDAAQHFAEAERMYRQALRIHRDALGWPHQQCIRDLLNLAYLLNRVDRDAEAVELMNQAIEGHRAVDGERHPLTGAALIRRGAMLRVLGNLTAAEPSVRAGLSILEEADPRSPLMWTANRDLGRICLAQQRFAEAEGHLLALPELVRRAGEDAQAAQWLIDLYERWHAQAPSAERETALQSWRGKLAAIEQGREEEAATTEGG